MFPGMHITDLLTAVLNDLVQIVGFPKEDGYLIGCSFRIIFVVCNVIFLWDKIFFHISALIGNSHTMVYHRIHNPVMGTIQK